MCHVTIVELIKLKIIKNITSRKFPHIAGIQKVITCSHMIRNDYSKQINHNKEVMTQQICEIIIIRK